MIRFVFQRLLQTIPVIWIIITATFFMIRLVPGGPFTAEKAVTPEIKRNLEAYYGMNKPLYQQYLDYCGKLLHGDLGPSFKYPTRSVNEIIGEKLPVSIELGSLSLAIALGIGLPLGVFAAVWRNTWIDKVCSSVAVTGICIPTFVLGPLLSLIFAIWLGWFDASGWFGPNDWVLPSVTLGLAYAAYVARLTRAGMLEVLNQDYIRTARAKGASESRIVLRHALRGGLTPVVSFLGPAIAGIVTGSFVIETIFQIPGIGREFVNSAFNRDYTLVLGTVILYAAFLIVMNLLADIALVWLNPRLKFE
ncbi:MAG TPA: ABC transporter permease [Opitutaceae bacterium]|jgi:oligopeptide transport system permease protein